MKRPAGVQKVQADRRPNGAPPTSRESESALYSSKAKRESK